MDFTDYVKQNQKVIQFVKDAMPGSIDKYVGTLDHASARFNTILLKLSQEPLMADQYKNDVKECFDAIQSFYNNTKNYVQAHYILQPLYSFFLFVIGTTRIPKIKLLLEKINN
jgi:hypothetical protein|tara:strand:+ start:1018 stop:1356 length:339 start_codon:yes stop_codon:yes gene_type:complete